MKNKVYYFSIIRKIIFVIGTCVCLYYTSINVGVFDIVLNDDINELFSGYSIPYYEMLSDNTGYTNINGISNFVNNMYSNGYELKKDSSTNNYIDYLFSKNDEDISWRLYYLFKDEYVAFFSSDYESSAQGYSYIVEEYKK